MLISIFIVLINNPVFPLGQKQSYSTMTRRYEFMLMKMSIKKCTTG